MQCHARYLPTLILIVSYLFQNQELFAVVKFHISPKSPHRAVLPFVKYHIRSIIQNSISIISMCTDAFIIFNYMCLRRYMRWWHICLCVNSQQQCMLGFKQWITNLGTTDARLSKPEWSPRALEPSTLTALRFQGWASVSSVVQTPWGIYFFAYCSHERN